MANDTRACAKQKVKKNYNGMSYIEDEKKLGNSAFDDMRYSLIHITYPHTKPRPTIITATKKNYEQKKKKFLPNLYY